MSGTRWHRTNNGCAWGKWMRPAASSEQLLMAYVKSASRSRSQLEVLISTYQKARTKTLKTQNLSIYALRFTVIELKEIHACFEKLSDGQIKKARSHAKTLRAGFLVENIPTTEYTLIPQSTSTFLLFRPAILLRGCPVWHEKSKARLWLADDYA